MRSRSGSSRANRRPVVVQHSFGALGSGGPIGALERALASECLRDRYEFVRMHQDSATGRLDWKQIAAWTAFLRDVEPDLVHVRGLGSEGFRGALAARIARCPRVLVSVHGTVRDLTAPRDARSRFVADVLEPLTLRLATHVTTVCHYAHQREFVQRHRSKLVGPIVNGVDAVLAGPQDRNRMRRELGAGSQDVVLSSVGRLAADKGHGDLAAALAFLSESSRRKVVLVVAGDGPDAAEIGAEYGALDIRVRMLGRRLDVPRVLAASDVFVFPSLHENLSNALLEAMAQAVPVIATNVGGNTEVVERGGGLLVAPRRPDQLASAIEELVQAPAVRRTLGAEAAAVVAEHYSMRAMERSLDAVYRQILTGMPP